MYTLLLIVCLSIATTAHAELPHLRVLQWAIDNGYHINPKLKFVHSINEETGAYYVSCENTFPLQSEEILIQTDYSNLLTVSTTIHEQCEEIAGSDFCIALQEQRSHIMGHEYVYRNYGVTMSLALYVAVVRKVNKGRFAGYLLNLPTAEMVNVNITAPMYYPDDQVDHFRIFGKVLFRHLLTDRTVARARYDLLPDSIRSLITVDDLKYAYYLVTTRAFSVTEPDKPPSECLIPLADYLNDHPTHDVYQELNNQPTSYIFKTRYGYDNTGGEIYGQYGRHTNAELAVQYGFVMDGNIHTQLSLDIIDYLHYEDHNYAYKKQTLTRIFEFTDGFPIAYDCSSPWNNNFIRFVLLSPEAIQRPDLTQQLLNWESDNIYVSEENELEVDLLIIQMMVDLKNKLLRRMGMPMFPLIKRLYEKEIEHIDKCVYQHTRDEL